MAVPRSILFELRDACMALELDDTSWTVEEALQASENSRNDWAAEILRESPEDVSGLGDETSRAEYLKHRQALSDALDRDTVPHVHT